MPGLHFLVVAFVLFFLEKSMAEVVGANLLNGRLLQCLVNTTKKSTASLASGIDCSFLYGNGGLISAT